MEAENGAADAARGEGGECPGGTGGGGKEPIGRLDREVWICQGTAQGEGDAAMRESAVDH